MSFDSLLIIIHSLLIKWSVTQIDSQNLRSAYDIITVWGGQERKYFSYVSQTCTTLFIVPITGVSFSTLKIVLTFWHHWRCLTKAALTLWQKEAHIFVVGPNVLKCTNLAKAPPGRDLHSDPDSSGCIWWGPDLIQSIGSVPGTNLFNSIGCDWGVNIHDTVFNKET